MALGNFMCSSVSPRFPRWQQRWSIQHKKIKYSPYMPCGDRISHVGFTMNVQDKIYHSCRVYQSFFACCLNELGHKVFLLTSTGLGGLHNGIGERFVKALIARNETHLHLVIRPCRVFAICNNPCISEYIYI